MIALDTSSVVHYLAGSSGRDVEAVDIALAESQGCLPPAVVSEILSKAVNRESSAELSQAA